LRSERPGQRRTAQIKSRSDVLDRVQALEQFEAQGTDVSPQGRLNRNAAKQLLRTRDQLLRTMGRSAGAHTTGEEGFLRSLLAAYPDRLARRREPGSRRGILLGGRGVRLADEAAIQDEELYVCVDLDSTGGEALVRQASAVERAWLPAEHLVSQTTVQFEEASGKIVALRRIAVGDLVLEESQAGLPSSDVIAEALAAAAASRLERAFPADDPAVAGFRARAECVAGWLPELDLPRLDGDQLRSLLPQLASGRRSLAEVRRAPWLAAMQGLFTWQQLQTLDREAPERMEVPSGSRMAMIYEVGRLPILAVRIQEVFGMMETPRIARGRVRVLMHLLAPNMRVAQVTDDLASFWANTYPLVRRDLRARYPKHAWPEDPLNAQPVKPRRLR
jgi:ATP-dependent helicase HrpB